MGVLEMQGHSLAGSRSGMEYLGAEQAGLPLPTYESVGEWGSSVPDFPDDVPDFQDFHMVSLFRSRWGAELWACPCDVIIPSIDSANAEPHSAESRTIQVSGSSKGV